VEALASVLDPGLISKVLHEAGKASKRIRALPAELIVWLLVGMSLFRGQSVKNVLIQLAKGLGVPVRWKNGRAPRSTSVTEARDRIGFEVVREIFRALAALVREAHGGAHLWKGLRTYVLDGTALKAPDTEENEKWFGRPKTKRGRSAFPQFRGVVLMAAWSHLALAAAFGPWATGELTIAAYLLPAIERGALVLMDRGYYAYGWIAALVQGGQHFVIRAKRGRRTLQPRRRKRLGPREWIADLVVPRIARKKDKGLPESLRVRVITYAKRGFRPATLVTSLLDPEGYPAEDIVLLYHGRWEIELGYDEIKTHLIGQRVAFRSKRPDRVLQEAYGLLIAYNIVRALMVRAAEKAGVEPRRLSFVDALARIQHAILVMAQAPTARLRELFGQLLADIAATVLPERRPDRAYPRAVKVKMSKYPLVANQVGRWRAPRKAL
jgi:hypothetical protein